MDSVNTFTSLMPILKESYASKEKPKKQDKFVQLKKKLKKKT